MTKKFILKFKLETFAGELEATHEEIESIPDFVVLKRIPEHDFSGNRGNLINYTEAYEATAGKPFSITIQEFVTYGDRKGNEYILKSEEMKTVKAKTFEVFWKNNSDELVNFHNQIRHLIDEDIIKYDFDNSTYTVPTDFTDQFLAAVEENNCIAEEV